MTAQSVSGRSDDQGIHNTTVHTVSFLIAFLADRPSFQIVPYSERWIDRGIQVF